LVTAGLVANAAGARARLAGTLGDGSALARLRRLVEGLGGDVAYVDRPERLPAAPYVIEVPAPRAGYVARVDALACGAAAMRLGAGRATKNDTIDPRVGIVVHAKVGDHVERGAPLFTVYSNAPSPPVDSLVGAVAWSETPVVAPPLVLDVIR
jgi:pyrimidine-nucleoside phosphorylase